MAGRAIVGFARRAGLALALGLLLATVGAASATAATKTQRLEEVKDRLEKERQNLKDLASKKNSILDYLEKLEQRLASTQKEYRLLNERIRELQLKTKVISNEITAKENEIKKSRKKLNRRLVTLYRLGELGGIKVLFTAESFAELLRRSHQLNLIVNKDALSIAVFDQQLKERARLLAEMETQKTELQKQEEKVQQSLQALREQKGKKEAAYNVVENEEGIHTRYVAELEESKKELENLLSSLARKKTEKVARGENIEDLGFQGRKGTFKAPIQGQVIKKFGKYRDEKYFTYNYHKGIDIRSKSREQRVQAIYNGRVVYSGWFKGFGQILIVDHGGGYHTLSAHAEELFKEAGQSVQEGEAVAAMGTAADAPASSNPALYFEVRENGKSVDPLEWLAKSQYQK